MYRTVAAVLFCLQQRAFSDGVRIHNKWAQIVGWGITVMPHPTICSNHAKTQAIFVSLKGLVAVAMTDTSGLKPKVPYITAKRLRHVKNVLIVFVKLCNYDFFARIAEK